MGTVPYSIDREFAGIDFKSRRLSERFIKTMETLKSQPDKSIWLCSGSRAEAKAVYPKIPKNYTQVKKKDETNPIYPAGV